MNEKTMQMFTKFTQRDNFVIVIISILVLIISFLYFSSQKSAWQHSTSTEPKQSLSLNEMPNVLNTLKMLQSVDFEVFGIVQGVFFRKYTREKGKELGLKGWCMNTRQDTVVGTIQGKEEKIEEMKDWLRHTGSPLSRIEKCVFKNDRHISKEEFDDFFIKKGDKFY